MVCYNFLLLLIAFLLVFIDCCLLIVFVNIGLLSLQFSYTTFVFYVTFILLNIITYVVYIIWYILFHFYILIVLFPIYFLIIFCFGESLEGFLYSNIFNFSLKLVALLNSFYFPRLTRENKKFRYMKRWCILLCQDEFIMINKQYFIIFFINDQTSFINILREAKSQRQSL